VRPFRAALAAFLVMAAFLACGRGRPSPTVLVGDGDTELLRIAEAAGATLPIFLDRLNGPKRGESGFAVKLRLPGPEDGDAGEEQVWLGNIGFAGGNFHGTLSNAPVLPGSPAKGERVRFGADRITDWMFLRDGMIVGGRSIRYLLLSIPEEERDERQRAILAMFAEDGL